MIKRPISVVIPHYNDLVALDRCLAALEAQIQPRDDYEIVVADNMSPAPREELEQLIAGRAQLTIVAEKGAGPARNGGVAASQGVLLAFIDSDCVPEPGWLANGLAALDNHDVVGGSIVVLVGQGRPKTGAEAFESVFAFDNRRYVEEEAFTVTANLFCRRSTYDRVGGFRTGVSEDKDWCQRARDLGFSIGYVEKAVVGHPARVSWAELRKKWQRLNVETYGLYRSRRFGKAQWLLRTWLLPLSILAHVPTVLASTKLESSAERRAGLMTLLRIRCWRFVHAHRLLLGAE